MLSAKCGDCGTQFEDAQDDPLPRLPCPQCGATTRVIEVAISESIELQDALQFTHKRPGYKGFLAKGMSGADFCHDRGKYVQKESLFDRQKDRRLERVVDPDTGEEIYFQDHSLSEHKGHGSAKLNK